jgi:hypothetical protein
MLCPQGVPYTRYPSYQPTTRILRRKKLRLGAGRSEPCCRGLLDTASWHKTNQQTHYLGLVGDLLNDLTGVNLAGFSFHKRFLSERFRPIALTSQNQQAAVSTALIRCSRSREPIMTNDSASLRSRVDVGARLPGIEHRREVSLSPTVSCWPRSGNFVKRLRSCVGMSRLFLFFLATMVSSQLRGLQLCSRPTQRAHSSKVAAKFCQCS